LDSRRHLVFEFDPDGNVVNTFGDWKVVLNVTHGRTIDYENNFWTAGNGDGIIQHYSHWLQWRPAEWTGMSIVLTA
jgi:hypothetical protein